MSTDSPLIVSRYLAPSAGNVELLMMTDNVALEGLEYFNITYNITGQHPPVSQAKVFFVNNIQVFIKDETGMHINFQF